MFYRSNGCPCLIGEVVSDKVDEEDCRRMLVQGIAATRAGRLLISPKPTMDPKPEFVLMAIYVSAKLVVTRHLLRVNPQEEKVRFRSTPVEVNSVQPND